jgi:NAD(P)-dependent dehydrogenase (short-subunit alcohol dehydrogenase family)
MFTYALARRLEGTSVVVNAVHPGTVRTGWARGADSGWFRFVVAATSPFFIPAEEGARTSIHVASAPELANVTGRYFIKRREAGSTSASRDVDAQERLWRESERATGATFTSA